MSCTGSTMRSTRWWLSLGMAALILHQCSCTSQDSPRAGEEEPHTAARSRRISLSVDPGPSSPRPCWVYTHLQKSGGSTIKAVLKERWAKDGAFSIYDSQQWLQGKDFTRGFAQKLMEDNPWQVAAGGYTEGLRGDIGKACKWFVQFRHPVSRLVSAYFYCKQSKDPICASDILIAENISLKEFAMHWGNFGVRQFVLGFIPVDEVVQYTQQAEMKGRVPGWYRLKMYLEHKGRLVGGDENTVLSGMLQDVQNLIRDKFDAVSILENFDVSLRLLDHGLQMPGLNWTASFAELGVHNVDKRYMEEEERALQEAWTNVDIKSYISLDLLLYEHASDVFKQQAELYGLT